MSDKRDFYTELNDLIIRAEMNAELMKTLKKDVQELLDDWDD